MTVRHNIAASEAVTLADAAVQLRRLAAMDGAGLRRLMSSAGVRRLVASVLAAVERAVAGRDGAAAASNLSSLS